MITRFLEKEVLHALNTNPVAALLGPRQIGKTTLALGIDKSKINKPVSYLDLELDSHLARLDDAEAYLLTFEKQLLIIDEIQRKPDLFPILRGLVDERRRAGEKSGQFLLLGSASRDLLQQSSETLAGRIEFLELGSLLIKEIQSIDPLGFNANKLWFRGGFPDSFLAETDDQSWGWRNDFMLTYLERDIPLMGQPIPATKMKRLWSMLAHLHGQQVNLSKLAESLAVSHPTARNYLDILNDFYMIRQIQPWSGNTKKRLIKAPKIYLRDSGLLHRLLNISHFEDLLGHPSCGVSWEGFIIENIILSCRSSKWQHSYYRTLAQAEIDLVLEGPDKKRWAIEIKRSLSPKVTKGFHLACEDVKATKKFVIYSGAERFPMSVNTEAIGIIEFLKIFSENIQ